jgi:hypothetical protein
VQSESTKYAWRLEKFTIGKDCVNDTTLPNFFDYVDKSGSDNTLALYSYE